MSELFTANLDSEVQAYCGQDIRHESVVSESQHKRGFTHTSRTQHQHLEVDKVVCTQIITYNTSLIV